MCTHKGRNQRRGLSRCIPTLTLAPLTLALSHQGRGEK